MAKKSFKDNINPALQFISNTEEKPEEKKESGTNGTQESPGQPPEGYKLNPLYVETKSRRLQLLMQPSLHAKIKDMAKAKGVSVNELIHAALEEYTKGE
jgi:hypothetical protein